MTNMIMFLSKHSLAQHDQWQTPDGPQAIWVERGKISISELIVSEGGGNFIAPKECIKALTPTTFLRFGIVETDQAPAILEPSQFLLRCAVSLASGPVIMRLDQVTFPPHARAYWHTHPGPGIRYLTRGELTLESAHDREIKQPGQAWFEGANSPAQATAQGTNQATAQDATPDSGTTMFVRAMILPVEFEGKPTFKLLHPEDRNKPALQTNKRFFDQQIIC